MVGAFPALNARPESQLDEWLAMITEELAAHDAANPDKPAAPFAVNQIVHTSNKRLEHDLMMCVKYKVPIVISSLGADDEGMVFNINADTIAAEIAVQLQAEKLILLSDVDGIYLRPGEPESKLSRLTAAETDELISSGAATGGMIPKLQSIATLLRRGVHSAHIISGSKRNALLSEVFTDKGTGTMIVA